MSHFLAQYLVDWATFLPSEEKLRDVIADAGRLTTGLVSPSVLAPNPSATKVLFGNNTWGDISTIIPDIVTEDELAPIAFSGSASDLSTGTIPLLRLPYQVPRTDLANTFSEDQNMRKSITIGRTNFGYQRIKITADLLGQPRINFIEGSGFTNAYMGLTDYPGSGLSIGTSGSNINLENNVVVTGNITASSFIKSGGTSSQFLKADGSSDSNSYYLNSNPSNFISLASLSAGTGINYNNTTGVISSTVTDPISGTGTTNYVSKFTSGSTLGDSQIFDDGTSVNIGTGLTINGSTADMTSFRS